MVALGESNLVSGVTTVKLLTLTYMIINFFFFFFLQISSFARLLTYVMQITLSDLIEHKLNMNNHSLDDCFQKKISVDRNSEMDTHDHVGKIFLHSWTVQKTCFKIFFDTA